MTACCKCGHDPDAVVGDRWDFVIDREVKSGNARVFNVGASRWQYKRDRDLWQWELKAVRLLRKIPKATKRRRVTLTRWYTGRQRPFDYDNLVFGMKPIVDAMVREGLLMGDSPVMAHINYEQRTGGGRGLTVLIEELA